MSAMSIKYILITPWNMALTAMFDGASLGFIKLLLPSIKYGGSNHESDFTPFLFGANLRKASALSPTVFASYSPTARANSLLGARSILFSPLIWGIR